jgi:hypothetical protein
MRTPASAAAALFAVFLAACPEVSPPNPQPFDRFYFPSGVVHVDALGSTGGVLFVANHNKDRRYDGSALMAIDLDLVDLPLFGAPVDAAGPKQVTDLRSSSAGTVGLSTFAGQLAALRLGPSSVRLFVPSRSEGMRFQSIDATLGGGGGRTVLSCHTPAGRDDRDCGSQAPSLTPPELERSATGLPRAPVPYGVAVRVRACASAADCGDGTACVAGQCQYLEPAEPLADVWVTHLSLADSPAGSATSQTIATNAHAYLVRLASRQPKVSVESFLDLGVGQGATNSVVAGTRWVYLSGRYISPSANLLRLVDGSGSGFVFASGLEGAYRVADGRGVALSSDERRVFIVSRSPDALVVAHIANPTGDVPSVQVERAVPIPAGGNELVVVSRAGRADLVAITSIVAGTVVLYDDDVGSLVAMVSGVGLQPYGIAVQRRGAGARLFVSNFGDGRVAVIDVADVARPHEARLVAHLGAQQLCLTRSQYALVCDGGTP